MAVASWSVARDPVGKGSELERRLGRLRRLLTPGIRRSAYSDYEDRPDVDSALRQYEWSAFALQQHHGRNSAAEA